MTTLSNGHGQVVGTPVDLPDLTQKVTASTPIAEGPTRIRTREETHASPRSLSAVTRLVPAALAGGSLWDAQPPSLAQIWARHCASAKYYQAGLIKGPRFLWGCLHLPLAALNYFLAWVTHSFPLLLVAVVLLGLGFWLHVI
jgi:Flp pilus assembly protein TadB